MVSLDPASQGAHPATDPRTVASDAGAAARATMAMLASRVVIAALGWVGSVIIARTLSPEGWGHYSFVFALLGLMAIFTDLGVGRAVLARLISDDKDDIALTASAFIALRVVLGLVGYVVAVAYVVILQYPGEVIRATAVAGLVVVVATPGHALTVLFQSRHRLVLTAVAESLGQAIQLAVTIAAASVAPYLLIFVLAPVINEVLALTLKAVGIARASNGLRPARRIEFDRWKAMLRDAAPLAIGFALTVALLKIDVLLLSLMDTFDAVGMYSIGYKFSDIIDTFALAAAGPVSTLLVAAWPHEHVAFRQRTRSAALLFALAGALAVAAFWPSAEKVIELLYGERFVPAAQASRLLVVGAALMSMIVLGIYLLAAAGKQRHYPLVAVGGLVLNVVANVILIPRMSYDGAAIATVLTLGVVVVALWIVIARVMPINALLPIGALSILVGATAVVCVIGTLVIDVVPWPIVSAAAVLAILGPAAVFRKAAGAPPPRHARRRSIR